MRLRIFQSWMRLWWECFRGDGIGPIIMEQALRVLKDLMAPEIESGRLKIKEIEG